MYAVSGGGGRKPKPSKVILHVYDLNNNNWTSSFGFGAHHTGVEVFGQEYSFAHSPSGSGVTITIPKSSVPPPAQFRESIEMGEINLTSQELRAIIENMGKDEFVGKNYHLTNKNCNHFSDALCMKLLNKHIPGWINRLANVGGSYFSSWFDQTPTLTPKQEAAAFSGQGHSLQSNSTSTPTSNPKGRNNNSTINPTPALASLEDRLSNAQKAIGNNEEDNSLTIQFRLIDGSKVKGHFNPSHTITDVRKFLDLVSGISTPYDIYSMYPRARVTDETSSLSQLNMNNSLLVQEKKV
eukprot:TRINITY_DN3686_c0_g1_i1.p1 TRINITY_DN3686_c0_g1~~TRINITY_DN3686_c0_g1_i1.p1  ORF type:complete len:296 (-),score=70.01 TRINITY_DN3686_c0_g1_i1:83-970(-)